MSYFNHAFKKVFVATMPSQAGDADHTAVVDGILDETGVSIASLKNPATPNTLGPGVVGFFDKNYESLSPADLGTACCPFYIAAAALKLNDKQGPFHGGYQEANKSKLINPKFLHKLWVVDGNLPTPAYVEIGNTTITPNPDCDAEFLCGETYYLRIDVKGQDPLRFANHNLYRTLDAIAGCCADPSNPLPVDSAAIYLLWANQIIDDPYLQDFIRPIIVADGESYAATQELADLLGLGANHAFADIPATTTTAGMVLMGAYEETKFGNCSFEVSDYYSVMPLQIYASEVDLNGDPCTFSGACVTTVCEGMQGNGFGEQKVRELILAESYLQNFMANDQRIREITQGTRAYEVLDRNSIYSSFFLQHSVPRFNNPSSTFDTDQYVLEVIGIPAMITAIRAPFDAMIAAGCLACVEIEDFSQTTPCTYSLPVIP